MPLARITDQRLELAIGRMLQLGVTIAALIVAIGGTLYLAHNHGPRPDYTHFHGTPQDLRSPTGVFTRAVHGDAEGLIQLGLLALIATPILRVIIAAGGFLLMRDRLYALVSAIVFAVLLWSLWHVR